LLVLFSEKPIDLHFFSSYFLCCATGVGPEFPRFIASPIFPSFSTFFALFSEIGLPRNLASFFPHHYPFLLRSDVFHQKSEIRLQFNVQSQNEEMSDLRKKWKMVSVHYMKVKREI